MRTLLKLAFLLAALPSFGASQITATITVTNNPLTGDYFTVNGTYTRTYAAARTATTINTGATLYNATTNLWLQIGSYPIAGITPYLTSSNKVSLIALPGSSLSITLATNWGTVSYSTTAVTTAQIVRVPMSVEPTSERTNIASQLARDLEASSPTAFSTGTTLLGNYVDKSTAQVLTGAKTLLSVTTSNLVNVGSAVSSVGTGTESEQFGTGARATNLQSLAVGKSALAGSVYSIAIGNSAIAITKDGAAAIGNGATATGEDALAVGSASSASGTNATAIGNGAQASATSSTAVGADALASGSTSVSLGAGSESSSSGIAIGPTSVATAAKAIAIGSSASVTYQNSIAIGYGVAPTASNQVVIGDSSQLVSVSGRISATSVTNATYYGTVGSLSGGLIYGGTVSNETITASVITNSTATGIAFPESLHTTLANGANSGVVFTNVFNRIDAGPTGAFSIAGVSGGSNGRYLIIYNATGQNMTLSHQSGTEATASNRIITMTGADVVTTGNGSAVLIYDSNASRWILISADL